MRRQLMAIVALAAVIPLAACGSSTKELATPRPLKEGTCYYLKDKREAKALEKQGRCPKTSTVEQISPTAEIDWFAFFNSAWYLENVVPTDEQSDFADEVTRFGNANSAAIEAAAPTAQYEDEDGTILTGSKAGVNDDGTSMTSEDDEDDNSSTGGSSGGDDEEETSGGSAGGAADE